MDVNSVSMYREKDGTLPCVAQFVRILLVIPDKTLLQSLSSKFEQQLYKVTTTESSTIALSLFRDNYYDIVIVDIRIREMGIYKFVEKLHNQRMTAVPIILIAKDLPMDSAKEALGNGVCYIFLRPPSHRDISDVWQHIPRVTGEMPALFDKTNYIDMIKDGNPSGGRNFDGAARNRKQRNSKKKLFNTDIENKKRRMNHIAEDSNFSNDSEEDDGQNCKKPRITWTSYLHEKFLQAINILGKQRAQPKTLLRIMNEPGLTPHHISSHLQKYRNQTRHSANPQKYSGPAMSTVQPAAPMSIFLQGQTSGTANFYTAAPGAPQFPRSPSWLKPPNFVGYTFDNVNEELDALNYSGDDNSIIANGGFQIPEGSRGVQKAPGIDLYDNTYENPSVIIGEQPKVFPQRYGHMIPASSQVIPATNHLIPASSYPSIGLKALNPEPAGATGDVILASGHPSNNLQALNQESAGDFWMGMYSLGNVGNPANMNNENVAEGTSATQEFDGMLYMNNINIDQIIQDIEASGVKFRDLID